MGLVALKTVPGIIKVKTDYDAPGRWIEADKMRDAAGSIETIGGYERLGSDTVEGCARGMIAWRDTNSQRAVIAGTEYRVHRIVPSGIISNITPARETGTLGTDPFTTTNGSDEVSVADTSHGLALDAYVTFSGATDTGGLVMNGEFQVIEVTSANAYVIQHTSAATSTATGGGASVAYTYEINPGLCDGTEGFGYGAGPYGTGFYGVSRPSSITLYPRTWSFDTWGEDIIGCPKGGEIYLYDTSAGGRMAIMSANAPTALYVFVTGELHVVALGADGDPYRIENSDQNDYTDWTSTTTNQADGFSLPGGDPLMGGRAYKSGMNCIWTRNQFWTRTLIPYRPFWKTDRIGNGMGLYGPHAHAELDSRVYWMSNGSFHVFDGVQAVEIPNVEHIRDYVFEDINDLQREKCWADTITHEGEVWFFYCSSASVEIDRAVVFVPRKNIWFTHTFARTTGIDRGVFEYPIWIAADGKLYEHELGDDADGSAMQKYAVRAPDDLGDGDVSMDAQQIVPDFKDQTGDVLITLYGKDKPRSTAETFGPYTIETTTEQEDIRASGRQLGYRVESNTLGGKFRHGKVRVDIQPSGERP